MARPREFDPDTAILDAMNVFWGLGYESASLPDLLDGMGLTRGSLYKAFKGKKQLFLTVLSHYEKMAVDPAVALLSSPENGTGLQRIEMLMKSIPNDVREGDVRGCLLCTTAAGAASEDQDIASAVHHLFERLRAALAVALADVPAAQAKQPHEIHAMSDALLAQYIGLRTLARAQSSATVLDNSVGALLSLFGES